MPPRLRLSDFSPSIRAALPALAVEAPTKRTRSASAPRGRSTLELSFIRQATEAGIPPWVEEYRFDADRKWRFDFAWPSIRLAVEVEGGTHSGGRHTRGAGYVADCDKYNAATISGWRVLRFPGGHLRRCGAALSPAIETLQKAIGILGARA